MKDIIENRKKKSEKYISYVFEGTGGRVYEYVSNNIHKQLLVIYKVQKNFL